MSRTRRRFSMFFLFILLVAGAVAWWGWQRYIAFADSPMAGIEDGSGLVVERGDSLPVVVRKLRETGVREGSSIEWRVLSREMDADGRLQVGEYALEPGTTPRELLVAMRDGKVVRYSFTVLPGRNFRELRAALSRAEPLRQEVPSLDDAALMKALGHAGQHPEGRFLPETYHYTRGDSDLDVLERAHQAMRKALAEAWETRAEDTQLKSPDEMLTLASIVEKETGQAAERPLVAAVFVNRLRQGMPLQSDPTVIYALPTFDGSLTRADLAWPSPYNTYVTPGLPPGPIANPGLAAIEAVLAPADVPYLYFVSRNDGSHVFSSTLAEHNRAVARYQRGGGGANILD